MAGSVAVAYNNNFQVTQQTVNGASGIAFADDNDGLLRTAGALTLKPNTQNGLLTGTTLGTQTSTQTYSGFGELIGVTRDGSSVLSPMSSTAVRPLY